MSNMKDLLFKQQENITAINQLYANFKKDGQPRKNYDYLTKRLDALENFWIDFHANHIKLCEFPTSSCDNEYFSLNQYDVIKAKYVEFKKVIHNLLSEQESRPQTPILKAATLHAGGTSSHGTNSKTNEMLQKQSSNFRALERTISGIKLDNICERWEFDDVLKLLQSRWTAIDSLHWEIDNECAGNINNKEYEDTFSVFEQEYQRIKRNINSKLSSMSHREKSTPQIDIPVFHGNYHQWVSFKDIFTETIHNNPSMSNVQKMQYLKSKVKGEAEKLIQHLPITSDNYVISWDILNNRYKNTKLIFNSHMNILTSIPIMQQATAGHIKRLHDTTLECLNAIKAMGVDTSTWDPMIVYFLSQKLDSESYNDYVESLKQPRDLPKLDDFLSFLENRFTAMESARRKQEGPSQKPYQNPTNTGKYDFRSSKKSYSTFPSVKRDVNQNNSQTSKHSCPHCNTADHGLYYCKAFLSMSPYLKLKTIEKLNLCKNCLYDHKGKGCYSERRCRECNKDHNTIMHDSFMRPNITAKQEQQTVKGNTHVLTQGEIPEVLLATALVRVQARDGSYHILRSLLDQGSQASIITENAAQLLGLERSKCSGVISGVGSKESNSKGLTHIKCTSASGNYSFDSQVFIMNRLVRELPSFSFPKPNWSFLEGIELADPEFNISRPIDILFGADVYSAIIMDGICRSEPNIPIAQQTRLGWILSGNSKPLQCNVTLNNIEELQKFWETEDISEETELSENDQECIKMYKATTSRLEDGRFQVRLPLKSNISQSLGESKNKAIAQFRNQERKFIKNSEFAKQYKLFIAEYINLGHMRECDKDRKQLECFLPHHGILKSDANISKFRVVFNASQKLSNGMSLNDFMYSGPNLQQDLQMLLLKWRQYQVGFTADIEKMFRCIWVAEEHQPLQKIIWRDSPDSALREYQLETVSYGLKPAAFLAMMTLKQLAHLEQDNYPSDVIKVVDENFYMDDLLHGCHSIEQANALKTDLVNLLKSGGFNLRKWKSNRVELLDEVDRNKNFEFTNPESTKTLGLIWDTKRDAFTFDSKVQPSQKYTKRSLLSAVSRIFDPLGWITPLTAKLKMIFQSVWETNTAWDDELPEVIKNQWIKLQQDIKNINQITIDRWYKTGAQEEIELHGFCDASGKAYACVIYCKIKGKADSPAKITLVAGKSRLVPTKKNISLPRLELTSALLLAKLMSKAKQALHQYDIKTFGWSDSMVALSWIKGEPGKWQVYVANRVRTIVETMPPENWKYVKSSENPADCASRGLTATQLKNHELWFKGPQWLSTYQGVDEPQQSFEKDQKIKKSFVQANVISQDNVIDDLLITCSTMSKAVRIIGWMRRFIRKNRNTQPYLSVEEIRNATSIIVKHVQRKQFSAEINDLEKQEKVSSRSKIINLNPFLDKQGVLRVGERLRNAHISEDMKHPAIIPKDGWFTELLVQHAHKLVFHGGARLTLSFIRKKYWIISGTSVTKKWIRLCVKCRRHAPDKQYQLMGDLPDARCNPSRPFFHTGVDYTGHIMMKASKGRGIKTTKGYVAVFVCMVSKAVHLELVSDLTAASYMACLRRMAARRGVPRHLYQDNATYFCGSSNLLQQEYQELQKIFSESFLAEIAEMEITFHFNAPSWPSAGGLWEAAVKSLKFHMKRVIGEQLLTYEELSTILAQIEGCLNSRPLCSLSDDPDDLDVLTPAHFLTGGPTLNFYDTEQDLRTRWYLSQKIFKDIWARWHTEYLTQLTARSKWSTSRDNLNLNDIVIIHDANLPPGKWAMGRVVELHPGSDGLVRVVTLKTKNGYMKRPIVKLSVLPTNNENANQKSENIKAISENAKQPQKDIKIIKKPNSTSNRCSFLSLAMSLILFMTLLSESYGSLNVTRFKPGQKLFFDKISHMQLASDTWKTVIYYDLEPYWQGNKAINKYVDHLNESCIRMVEKEHCNVIILQLDQELAELKHYNNLLMSQHAGHAPRARRRRGIVNGVGYLANKLFGVLDQEFAEQYERDINILKHNQDHLALLWKNQTSIIEAEYNLLKRTEIGMNKQQKLINQHFIALEKDISQINQKQTGAYALVQFTLEALTATNMINSIKQIQNTLLDMVTDIYQGHFNYHILTPEQFRKELNLISSEISKDLSLPIKDIQNHLNNLYQLLGVRTRMSEQCLIFEVTIPLVSRDSFEIFNVIPIPELWNDRMVIVKPRSDYVALSLRKNAYVLMTEAEVQSCTHQDEEVSYCRTNNPVFHMKRDEDLCQAEEDSNKCLLQTSKCKDQWINIHQSNNYIYFCCEACRVRIICEDQVSSQSLTGVGILTIGHGCLVRTNQFSLQSHKPGSNIIKTKSEVVLPYISPINDVINVSSAYKLTWNESEVDYKELKDLQGRIKMMKEAEPLAGSITYHDVHHYTAIYASFGLLIVVALLAWWGHARLARLLPAAPAAAVAPPAREGPPPPPPRAAAPRAPPPQGGDPVAHCVSVVSDNMGNQCNKIKAISVDNVQVYSEIHDKNKTLSVPVLNKGTSPIARRVDFKFNINDS